MGPNGSGKSTLSATLAGREDYEVTHGSVEFNGKDLLEMSVEERAGEGIFMAFQYPVEIPGDLMEEKIKLLKMPEDLLTRSVNVGFSGGEKKRNDILQMAVLEPELCILDETDSGLDIDALKIVADGVNSLRDGKRAFIIVTHYQRILDYIKPDYVHENWKYTPLDGLLNGEFVTRLADISPAQRDALALTVDAVRLVFVDGQFRPELSDSTQDCGFEIAINDDRQSLSTPVQPEVFLHLTESLARSVTHIRVKRNQRPVKPLLLMHITQGADGDEINTAHYRHHLELAEGAEATPGTLPGRV
nr:unnamed protein product [Digitaria exilis]